MKRSEFRDHLLSSWTYLEELKDARAQRRCFTVVESRHAVPFFFSPLWRSNQVLRAHIPLNAAFLIHHSIFMIPTKSTAVERNNEPVSASLFPGNKPWSLRQIKDKMGPTRTMMSWSPQASTICPHSATPPFFFFFWVAKINVDRINKRVSKRRRTCRSFQHVRFDGIIPTVRLIVACPPVCWYSAFGSPQQVRISFRNLIFLGY